MINEFNNFDTDVNYDSVVCRIRFVTLKYIIRSIVLTFFYCCVFRGLIVSKCKRKKLKFKYTVYLTCVVIRILGAGDWRGAVTAYRSVNMWEDALRVAKKASGEKAAQQVEI